MRLHILLTQRWFIVESAYYVDLGLVYDIKHAHRDLNYHLLEVVSPYRDP